MYFQEGVSGIVIKKTLNEIPSDILLAAINDHEFKMTEGETVTVDDWKEQARITLLARELK
jgi:hypothetical protein